MTDTREWEGRVGRSWAAEWRRTDRSFAALTDRLLARIAEYPPRDVLDVGCGAGELSLAVARGHPGAHVVGVDVSAELVAAANARAGRLANVRFALADAAQWRTERGSPDLVMSRHGVMFFADPTAAFTHLGAIAAPGARLVFSCFRARTENAWANDIARLLPGDLAAADGDDGPGPFAFADDARVAGILAAAGWRDAAFEPVDFAYVAGMGDDAVADAQSFFLSIGPAARAAAALGVEARAQFVARLGEYLEAAEQDGIVALRGAAWIVTALRP